MIVVLANQHKVLLTDHLYPATKHFSPDGSVLFRDDSTSILHRIQKGSLNNFDDFIL